MKNSRAAFMQEAQRGASIGADYLNQLQGEIAGAKPDGQAGLPRKPGNQGGRNNQAGNGAASPLSRSSILARTGRAGRLERSPASSAPGGRQCA